jgi:hypothetical protein
MSVGVMKDYKLKLRDLRASHTLLVDIVVYYYYMVVELRFTRNIGSVWTNEE